jgi:hypothetical protein
VPYFEGPLQKAVNLKVIGSEPITWDVAAHALSGGLPGVTPLAGEILTVAVPLVPKDANIAGSLVSGPMGSR